MGQEIYKSSQRLERLIENFLIYAQLELIAADPKNVNALRDRQNRAAGVARPRTSPSRRRRRPARLNDLTLEPADVPVPMSEEYFSKIVDELVQNAFKFSEAGTPVRVTLAEAFNGIELSVTRPGPRIFHRANPPHRRLHAVRPQNAGPAGLGPGTGHCQAARRIARRRAFD